jgi:hypothetical protein
LPRNGPSGRYSEALDVARAPVVEQREAEHVVAGLARRDARARGTGDERELELDVELLASARSSAAGRAGGRSGCRRRRPSPRGRVADRQVAPVRRQRVVGAELRPTLVACSIDE